ncbi:MAG: arylesterase [Burkholderiales bacterium]|nr:arylesterase [Burkholderiales bacterium]
MSGICRLVFAMLGAAAIALAGGATAADPAVRSKPAILVYGDSLSAEYGLARGTGWAALLEQRLRQQAADYSVVNASISGETTAGGASRIAAELARVRPAVVIIELGGNDGLRGLALTATRANLETMITAAKAAGARVVLCGMQLPPNYGRDYTQQFRELYGALARAHGVALVPFFLDGIAERRELFQPDGIHPGTDAQPRILDNVWPVLAPLLKPRRR